MGRRESLPLARRRSTRRPAMGAMPATAWKRACHTPTMELHVAGLGSRTASMLGTGAQQDVYSLDAPFPQLPELRVAKLEAHTADAPEAEAAASFDGLGGFRAKGMDVRWMVTVDSASRKPLTSLAFLNGRCANRYGELLPLSVMSMETLRGRHADEHHSPSGPRKARANVFGGPIIFRRSPWGGHY